MNIYLIDSDEEAIVDKHHEELYDKTNEHFKGECQEELSVGEVCQPPQSVSESVQDLFCIP